MLGGRVKTLHPAIHAGLLARRNDPSHVQQLSEQGFEPIDLVVSNLYAFEEVWYLLNQFLYFLCE